MTSNLERLLEVSGNKAYFYKAYEGFKTVESLKQQYIYMPQHEKDVFLLHMLKNLKEIDVRSAIIFADTCRSCELLSLLLEELELENAALHSLKSQSSRLSALHQFKSGRVSVLIATDVANRGLDIPTVDLVLNYDVPRYPEDYIHRVGRTARAGRGGLALSFVTPNDVNLLHQIESVIGKPLEKFDCDAKDVVEDNMTKVYKAKRVVTMKMMDDGFEEKVEARKAQKLKTLEEKGLLKENSRNRNMLPGKTNKKRKKDDGSFEEKKEADRVQRLKSLEVLEETNKKQKRGKSVKESNKERKRVDNGSEEKSKTRIAQKLKSLEGESNVKQKQRKSKKESKA